MSAEYCKSDRGVIPRGRRCPVWVICDVFAEHPPLPVFPVSRHAKRLPDVSKVLPGRDITSGPLAGTRAIDIP